MAYPTFSKDTRSLLPGEYYVAIQGESFDGHDFIPKALQQGAAGLVVERPIPNLPQHVEVIVTENAIAWLVAQAQQRIRELQPKIVGITGSVGKTSTRKAVAHVLRGAFPVVEPQGNLNTPLGLALTILNGLTESGSVLVLEMGARNTGDILELTQMFRPDVSVVTTVQGVHLETFGTIDHITAEKGVIVAALTENGIACLNYDDPRVRSMADRCKGRVLFYSAHAATTEIVADLIPKPYPILGAHAIYTILAAYSVGTALGLSRAQMLPQIQTMRSEKGRLSKLPGKNGAMLIDDTYNAAPAAVLSALETLEELTAGEKVAFLGDMLELGTEEAVSHQVVIQRAKPLVNRLFLVGPRMKSALEVLGLTHAPSVFWYPDSQTLADALRHEVYQPHPKAVLLVKGSQGLRMERVSEALLDPAVAPESVLVRQDKAWKSK